MRQLRQTILLLLTVITTAEEKVVRVNDHNNLHQPFAKEIGKVLTEFDPLLTSILHSTSSDIRCQICSIVGPEIIRYNFFLDAIETTALEVLYVRGGTTSADFSIGPFQMKPSFAELLESHVKRTSTGVVLRLPRSTPSMERRGRIERLKHRQWQVLYAFAFWKLCEVTFRDRGFKSIDEKVSFYATAYNVGFHKGQEIIEEMQGCAIFPYGKRYRGKQFSYGNLAMQFYSHCIENLNNPKYEN